MPPVSITLTVDDATAARIARAVGNRLSLQDAEGRERAATSAEVKGFIVNYLRAQVRDAERSASIAAIAEPDNLPVE